MASKLGFKVVAGNRNWCTLGKRTITINFRQNMYNCIYSLAHEIGHAKTLKSCVKDFGYSCAISKEKSYAGIESEFRAWCVADNLIRKLNLFGNDYVKYKHSCLRTYYT